MIIGTTNVNKVKEIGGICLSLGINLITTELDIPETGVTFEENALIKAKGYSKANPNQFVLSEDSGISIPILSKLLKHDVELPGVWSARFNDMNLETLIHHESNYSREEIDILNNKKVHALLKNVPEKERGAHFTICMIIMYNEKVVFQTTRKVYGHILNEPVGTKNFGYDCLFASDTSFGKSWAEIDSMRKNLISHRGMAIRDLQSWLCSEAGKQVI